MENERKAKYSLVSQYSYKRKVRGRFYTLRTGEQDSKCAKYNVAVSKQKIQNVSLLAKYEIKVHYTCVQRCSKVRYKCLYIFYRKGQAAGRG